MSTVPMITDAAISGMSGLSERPVFFLKLNGSAQNSLVVKAEPKNSQDAVVSIKWSSKLMKAVENDSNRGLVNTKIMTPSEIAQFRLAAARLLPRDSKPYANSLAGSGADIGATWVKMPFAPGLSDANYLDKREDGTDGDANLNKAKEIIKRFSSEEIWFQLGEVSAVDIFNGNQDRLRFGGMTMANLGNVMLTTPNPGQPKVVGLDTFDSSQAKGTANLNVAGTHEALDILIDKGGKLKKFSEDVTTSFGTNMSRELKSTLKAKNNELGTTYFDVRVEEQDGRVRTMMISLLRLNTLFLPYAEKFAEGIQSGSMKLHMHLDRKVREYRAQQPQPPIRGPQGPLAQAQPQRGIVRATPTPLNQIPPRPNTPAPHLGGKTIPQGILDRMAYLGWNVV